MRTLDPYKRLARGQARPHHTILVHFTSTPLSTLFASLYRRQPFLAFVAFVALLSEVLVVVLAGVPFSSSQTWIAFLVSAYLSMGILGLMILTLLSLFFWRRKPIMPRMPNTVAATMSYLCASHMRKDFEKLGGLRGTEEMAKVGGERYAYGLSRGTDMVTRWAVDKDTEPGDVEDRIRGCL